MNPIEFKGQTAVLGKNQPYRPLPVHINRDGGNYPVTSCWKLTFRERVKLLFTGRLWLQQLTFGKLLQPQLPSLEKPFENEVNR
jgi:hypothetical protein